MVVVRCVYVLVWVPKKGGTKNESLIKGGGDKKAVPKKEGKASKLILERETILEMFIKHRDCTNFSAFHNYQNW